MSQRAVPAALRVMLAMLCVTLLGGVARAEVASDAGARREDDAGVAQPPSSLRREGDWPSDERVSLKVERMPRSEAIRKLADEVGWSVIVRGVGDDLVDVRVMKQPAVRVLELLLAGEPFVAQRDGTMIAIAPASDVAPIVSRNKSPTGPNMPVPPAPPKPPKPPKAPKAPKHGDNDRLVTAGDAVIRADEVIDNLTVLAGDVDVYGTINEDLAVFAGDVRIHDGAHIAGDISALAGEVDIAEGAQVDGDVSGLAGQITRGGKQSDDAECEDEDEDCVHEAAAQRLTEKKRRQLERMARRWSRGHIDVDRQQDDQDEAAERAEDAREEREERAPDGIFVRIERAGSAVARSALLFAFGAIVLAFAGSRAQRLQAEVATRPVHALVVGGVCLIIAPFALLVGTVTIIGIPLVLVAIVVGTVGTYIGICAALTAIGRVLLHRRTPSAYAHLALGCALYLVASSLPGVGWLVTGAVVLIGLGALIRTRGAGLFTRSVPPPAPPPPLSPSTELGPEL